MRRLSVHHEWLASKETNSVLVHWIGLYQFSKVLTLLVRPSAMRPVYDLSCVYLMSTAPGVFTELRIGSRLIALLLNRGYMEGIDEVVQ